MKKIAKAVFFVEKIKEEEFMGVIHCWDSALSSLRLPIARSTVLFRRIFQCHNVL